MVLVHLHVRCVLSLAKVCFTVTIIQNTAPNKLSYAKPVTYICIYTYTN